MRPRLRALANPLLTSVLAALAALAGGCADDASGTTGELPPDSPGFALFQRMRCDTCHGADANGLPRIGPPLHGIAANWTREELVAYLQDPAPFRASKPHLQQVAQGYMAHMRPFPELSEKERGVLGDWLLAR